MTDQRRDWLADCRQVFIRHVPRPLMEAVKAKGKAEHRTIQEVTMMLWQKYVAGMVDISGVPANPVHHPTCPRYYSSRLKCNCMALGTAEPRVPCRICGRKTIWTKRFFRIPDEVMCTVCFRATHGYDMGGVRFD